MSPWRDSDGRPFVHTYFFPAEQYNHSLIDQLAHHCQAGWGEIEIHLHHGITTPDTAENTRHELACFRDTLVEHGCLSRWNGSGQARYGFVHGNWALANCLSGPFCGVDNEMQILADTGCYADFTYPAAPSPAQIGKINSVYECSLPLDRRAPHRKGRNLKRGLTPSTFPLIVQGPLGMEFMPQGARRRFVTIENAEVTTAHPPTLHRFNMWRDAAVTVQGRPDWVFIKLHCHGMDPRDRDAMLGAHCKQFLEELTRDSQESGAYRLHFVTGREMVNILLAACDGREGAPNDFRDYRLQLITPVKG